MENPGKPARQLVCYDRDMIEYLCGDPDNWNSQENMIFIKCTGGYQIFWFYHEPNHCQIIKTAIIPENTFVEISKRANVKPLKVEKLKPDPLCPSCTKWTPPDTKCKKCRRLNHAECLVEKLCTVCKDKAGKI